MLERLFIGLAILALLVSAANLPKAETLFNTSIFQKLESAQSARPASMPIPLFAPLR